MTRSKLKIRKMEDLSTCQMKFGNNLNREIMKNISRISKALILSALSVIVLFGCKEEILEETNGSDFQTGATAGAAIAFGVNDLETRTAFNSNNPYQINWSEGDKIQIFCPEGWYEEGAEKNASYQIMPDYGGSKKAPIQPVDAKKVLRWGGDMEHNFYAFYPVGAAEFEGGKATFSSIRYQTCTTDGESSGTLSLQKYTAEPDMNNAIMVAKTTCPTPTDKVPLKFKPIMTTLRFTVKSPALLPVDDLPSSWTEAGWNAFWGIKTDEEYYNAELKFNGLEIEFVNNVAQNTGNFTYDIDYDPATADPETKQVTNGIKIFNVQIHNSATKDDFLTLTSQRLLNGNNFTYSEFYQQITLTAFLPPVEISASNPIKIRLADKTITFAPQTPIPAGSIADITLPALTPGSYETTIDYANWVSSMGLTDDVLISQLSIPGSHASSAVSGSGAQWPTQTLSIANQWAAGVRCFDFSADVKSDVTITTTETGNWENVYERTATRNRTITITRSRTSERNGTYEYGLTTGYSYRYSWGEYGAWSAWSAWKDSSNDEITETQLEDPRYWNEYHGNEGWSSWADWTTLGWSGGIEGNPIVEEDTLDDFLLLYQVLKNSSGDYTNYSYGDLQTSIESVINCVRGTNEFALIMLNHATSERIINSGTSSVWQYTSTTSEPQIDRKDENNITHTVTENELTGSVDRTETSSNILVSSGTCTQTKTQTETKVYTQSGKLVESYTETATSRSNVETGVTIKNNDITLFGSEVATMLNNSSDKNLFVVWRPDLTLGECRGKVVLVSSAAGAAFPYAGIASKWDNTAWASSADASSHSGTLTSTVGTDGTTHTGTFFYQDYASGDSQTNAASINAMLDYAAANPVTASNNYWMFNYASSSVISGSNVNNNTAVSAANDAVINYFGALTSGTRITPGIILFDHAGVGEDNNDTAINKGQKAVRAVIDNNKPLVK